MSFKIVQKKNRNAIYASGFWKRERAEAWLRDYIPQHWMEKDVTADDLEIIEE